jgi:hypothetical protein
MGRGWNAVEESADRVCAQGVQNRALLDGSYIGQSSTLKDPGGDLGNFRHPDSILIIKCCTICCPPVPITPARLLFTRNNNIYFLNVNLVIFLTNLPKMPRHIIYYCILHLSSIFFYIIWRQTIGEKFSPR